MGQCLSQGFAGSGVCVSGGLLVLPSRVATRDQSHVRTHADTHTQRGQLRLRFPALENREPTDLHSPQHSLQHVSIVE